MHHIHRRRQAAARKRGLRQGHLVGRKLHRGDVPTDCGGRFGQPQRRITVGGADFQHAPRGGGTYQHGQELPGVGRDIEHAPATRPLLRIVVATEPYQFVLQCLQIDHHHLAQYGVPSLCR